MLTATQTMPRQIHLAYPILEYTTTKIFREVARLAQAAAILDGMTAADWISKAVGEAASKRTGEPNPFKPESQPAKKKARD